MVPAVIYFLRQRTNSPTGATKRLILGLKGFNVVVALMIAGISLVWLLSPRYRSGSRAGTNHPRQRPVCLIGGGAVYRGRHHWQPVSQSAAPGQPPWARSQKSRKSFGRALVFVGLAEGIGIYGLIIAVLILNR